MAINESDINLVTTQVMDDVPEGGGAPTSKLIEDGKSNAIFKDISAVDRAQGDFSIMKVAAVIQTMNTDTALGGVVIISRPPADPKVNAALFYTGDFFDRRASIQNRIEAYTSPGEEFNGYLLSNHVQGQRSLQIFQRPGATPPSINATLQISGGGKTEYVRISDVAVEQRTYSYSSGGSFVDYPAQVCVCEIVDGLKNDYTGTAASRLFERSATAAAINKMLVANASKFYSIAKVTVPVSIGDLSAKVDTITTQLVPSATTEIPLTDRSAGGSATSLVASGAGTVSLTTGVAFGPNSIISFGNPAYPGSLSVATSAGTLTDDGGRLKLGALTIGTVNYAGGAMTFASDAPAITGNKTISFRPAGAPIELADSTSIAVTAENRRANYPLTILPPPAPGSLRVAYRAGGNWYELADDGGGRLSGADSSIGSGTIDFATGTALPTLGALPDVGSEVIFTWAAKSNYKSRSGTLTAAVSIMLALDNLAAQSGTVSVDWNDGAARHATDNGSGALTGDATGPVSYASSTIEVRPNVLPASAVAFTVGYSHGDPSSKTFPAPARDVDGAITLNLGKTNIAPRSLSLDWNLVLQSTGGVPADQWVPQNFASTKTVTDNGAGKLVDGAGVEFGTLNYTTGVAKLYPEAVVSVAVPQWAVSPLGVLGTVLSPNLPGFYRNTLTGYAYAVLNASLPTDSSALVTANFRVVGAGTTKSQTFNQPKLSVKLLPNFSEAGVPGSVNFTFGGKTYFDRAGSIYTDLDPATGAATLAGTYDYATNIASLTNWPATASTGVVVNSLLTSLDSQPVEYVVFRTPVAPVSPGTLQLLATKLNGGTINVTADASGFINGANVHGTFDAATGVGKVRFGDWVTAAGNEGAIWYSADAVGSDGKIWKPVPVFASTIRYNAVAYTTLPVDATLLGIDPVRLPPDGRVPIFRKGELAVIHNTKRQAPVVVSNGQTLSAGRERLSRAKIIGGDGVTIQTGYTRNLDAGTVTFTDVSGYVQPIIYEHRIEDMLTVSDVGIDGRLAFAGKVSHAYTAGDSYVSSALRMGDVKARVSLLFDQQTWTGAWSDALIGNAADPTFNDIDNPITVTNKGAVTERWRIQINTGGTTYNLIGEHVGQIVTGQSLTADCSPLGPSGVPYMTIPAAGFGSGWAAGHVIRFNTIAATFPFVPTRTVQMGAETVLDDSFEILVLIGVDRP
ncbi:hypothetical protein QTI51_04095 [Variovorax sp. J22G73]|uniref:hypothetical protein n=1 Tax=unclassified Variovorax TaxID=663243 RepID=UPI0025752DEE|nr:MULTISPECIES: hypothetical protein [unclassified Variovorax]MDM0003890.1 hypothetical protein [Variovorax sp. J22R203]MDM0096444.1 hypothetical protein [Variovorax sp. J22G73]